MNNERYTTQQHIELFLAMVGAYMFAFFLLFGIVSMTM